MKNKIKNVLLFLLTWLIAFTAYSQTDSTKVEYTQEKETKESKMYGAICDVLTRRENKGKNLWKFNLVRTFLDGFTVAYERKIAPKWSLNVNSVTNISELGVYDKSFPRYNTIHSQFDFKERLSIECRYYYNTNRRIRLGKKGGFSGNYFSLGTINEYNYRYQKAYVFPPYDRYDIKSKRFSQSANFIYGIQRKIGRIGYINVSVGLEVMYVNTGYYMVGYTKNTYSNKMLWYSLPIDLGFGIAF